jgi:hypothetical protein
MLSHRLSGKGLRNVSICIKIMSVNKEERTHFADSGRTAEESNMPTSFTTNDIVEAGLVHSLRLGKSENELFLVFGKNKGGKCIVIELDVLNEFDVEEQPLFLLERVAPHPRQAEEMMICGES